MLLALIEERCTLITGLKNDYVLPDSKDSVRIKFEVCYTMQLYVADYYTVLFSPQYYV